jgi:hypothetical protein
MLAAQGESARIRAGSRTIKCLPAATELHLRGLPPKASVPAEPTRAHPPLTKGAALLPPAAAAAAAVPGASARSAAAAGPAPGPVAPGLSNSVNTRMQAKASSRAVAAGSRSASPQGWPASARLAASVKPGSPERQVQHRAKAPWQRVWAQRSGRTGMTGASCFSASLCAAACQKRRPKGPCQVSCAGEPANCEPFTPHSPARSSSGPPSGGSRTVATASVRCCWSAGSSGSSCTARSAGLAASSPETTKEQTERRR